ncbi:PqqD family protein [Anabaena minutissima FACHB-250]|nr:PqqD family protein [Anabaena minutissima FACHB-250]
MMEKLHVPVYVSTTFFEESAILLDSQKNRYYTLNDSAAEFWKLLTKLGSFEEAIEELSYLYEGYSDDFKKDMEFLVNDFMKAGLLETGANIY